MPTTYGEHMGEMNDSIRSHYITGHFDLETALARTENAGLVTLPRERAVDLLRQPITPYRVKVLTGKDVTEEQIAARLAEVSA